ncbi:B12-binding domain-containing radical SAM protein [Thermodesulfobacteriota bacterium]
MYTPAYPLPIMEIGSFVKKQLPAADIEIVSMPVDYGMPLNKEAKEKIYKDFLRDLAHAKPKGVGISCTAIAQAKEAIQLAELVKEYDPETFVFLGGYFPSIYYQEIFARTSAVDLIVIGEGEVSTLQIVELLEKGEKPFREDIPNLVWKKNGRYIYTKNGVRFDLNHKAHLNLSLLRYNRAYEILPYAFSRGCPYQCNYCMESLIRPVRRQVPSDIIYKDLKNLSSQSHAKTLLISDALFKSFDLFPLLRTLGLKVNFETRGDVFDPSIIPQIKDVLGMIAIGFESASYQTLRRMNKVRDRSQYEKYISNTIALFNELVDNEIPVMIFMIAGYPGDTEEDLEESFAFARELSKNSGSGGHVFKIGECHVYPRTKTYDHASSMPDAIFDDDGVFGENIVRQPSKGLNFETVLDYIKEIYSLSNQTTKLKKSLMNIMPFFRLPAQAFGDKIIPGECFKDKTRGILNVHSESLSIFRKILPKLSLKYNNLMSAERTTRHLSI